MRKAGMVGPEERVRNVLSETTQTGLMREEPSGTARFVFSNISAIFQEYTGGLLGAREAERTLI